MAMIERESNHPARCELVGEQQREIFYARLPACIRIFGTCIGERIILLSDVWFLFLCLLNHRGARCA